MSVFSVLNFHVLRGIATQKYVSFAIKTFLTRQADRPLPLPEPPPVGIYFSTPVR